MKTAPPSTQSTSSTTTSQSSEKPKTESKPPQKEFKKVLHDKSEPDTKSQVPKKGFKLDRGTKQESETSGQQPLTTAGRKPISAKSDEEDSGNEFGSKKKELPKKEPKEDLKEFSVPNMMMMGPSTVHKAEVQKAGGPALNIREIESIVKKVQVGMNEKGLPEMNFELMTDKLGSLNLKISSDNEKIRINFVTQDASAQAELEKGMKDLSALLGQKGLNLSETNVMTRDQQSQQQQQENKGRGDSQTGGIGDSSKSRSRKKISTGRSDDGFEI
jgi:flagellar hook-length control protein FliK